MPQHRFHCIATVLACVVAPTIVHAQTITTLYDGSAASHPSSQGWVYGFDPIFTNSSTRSIVTGGSRLDTSAVTTDKAGYFSRDPLNTGLFSPHPNVGTLDRTLGYTFRIDLQMLAESHNPPTNNRAGFSIVLINNDLTGIELGFWLDELWSFDDQVSGGTLVARGETVALDTTARRTYDIAVSGTGYAVYATGINSPVLSGPLRDYTAATVSPDVYEMPNFIFFGDDTSSASSRTDIFNVALLDAAVPEPAVGTILLLGAAAALRRRR